MKSPQTPIPFVPQELDPDKMELSQLKAYLITLEEELAQLDAREPADEASEAYEAWADEHEELEDWMDEIKERIEEKEA